MWNSSLVPPHTVGKLFVVSAPAGTGKTTLVKQLVATFDAVSVARTLTTRQPRRDEVNGKDYLFVERKEFEARRVRGDLVESVELHGNLYGTVREEVDRLRYSGKHVVLVIDTAGARIVKEQLQAVLIFIRPPSMKVLAERLKGRNSEKEETLHQRLELARLELEQERYYHYTIVNEDLHDAFSLLASIVVAETHRVITQE